LYGEKISQGGKRFLKRRAVVSELRKEKEWYLLSNEPFKSAGLDERIDKGGDKKAGNRAGLLGDERESGVYSRGKTEKKGG